MQKTLIFLGLLLTLLTAFSSAAFAASSYSITVATSAPSYVQGQTVTVSGVVSPAPPAGTTVTLHVTTPTGGVYIDSTNPSSTGAYSFSFVLSPKSNWPVGTYKVNVTWAESYQGPFASNTTTFTVTAAPTPVTVTPTYTVKVYTSTPLVPGQELEVEALAMFSNGSPVTSASFPVAEFVTPSGVMVSLGTSSMIQKGVYMWSYAVPSNYATGVYSVLVEANVSGITEWATSSFTLNAQLATSAQLSSINNSLSSINSSVSNLSGQVSSLSGMMTTDYSSVMSSLASISTMITDLKSAVSGIPSAVSSALSSDFSSLSSTLGGVSSTVNTLSSTVSTLQSTTSTVSSSVASLQSSITSLTTYLLVVAVLAIIIIVLELVILVRKK